MDEKVIESMFALLTYQLKRVNEVHQQIKLSKYLLIRGAKILIVEVIPLGVFWHPEWLDGIALPTVEPGYF
jgi:hypothetical protein